MGTIPDVTIALGDQVAELSELLAPLTDADWDRPSPCEGWSVSDVVLHLAQTNEMAIGSARGRFEDVVAATLTGATADNVDDGAALAVDKERGQPGDAVRARWQAGAEEMREALASTDPHARVTWVAGGLSVHTLTTTRLAETWIHTGDVANALGVTLLPTDRLWHIARLAWRTLPYAFARAGQTLGGPVAFDLTAPDGEDVWQFSPDDAEPATYLAGPADELCLVAARRVHPSETRLAGTGPDLAAVLDLVRTYA